MAERILLLEDDRLFNETLCDFLEEEGYETRGVMDPRSALELSYSESFDLYLFDINLPFEDGISLLSSLRDGDDRTPAILITSREDKKSLLEGFKAGCDDYLRKPVDLDELLLRIKARLGTRERESIIEVGEYSIDISRRKVSKAGEEIELGRKIFDLLTLLAKSEGRVVTIDEIVRKLWSDNDEPSYGAIRVYITRLKKLFGDRIENVRGVGYIFKI
jgi:DNA-binding response OmpR family regulator